MDGNAAPRVSKGIRVRWTARVIMILWALFWLWFALAGGIGELRSLGPMGLVSELLVVAIMVLCLLIAWFAELVGGLLLIAAAAVAYFFFHIPSQFGTSGGTLMLLVMVLPPLLAGVLLIVNCWVVFKGGTAPPEPAT